MGKLVFSSSSQARAFFGLTVRRGDASADGLLMGQASLSIHNDPSSGLDVDGVGFFCELADNKLQLPITERGFVDRFSDAVGFARRGQPGLSVAIPYVRTDLAREGLLRSLLRNYYFPILVGQLESDVAGTPVSAESFGDLARKFGGDRLSDGRVIAFVREIRAQLDHGTPDHTLQTPILKTASAGISDELLEKLRGRFAAGDLVHIRAPVILKHRQRGPLASTIDLFLRLTDGEGQGLVVRGGITLPQEGLEFRSRKCFGALVASDDTVAEFLGDAENPAHTKWNRNAEKLNANWSNGAARLTEVRGSLNVLYSLLAQSMETVEKDAFLDIFSAPGAAGEPRRNRKSPVPDPAPFPEILRKPTPFDIRERKGGFTVTGTGVLNDEALPLSIRVEAAYDLAHGDPFKRHSDVDFDFRRGGLRLESTGASLVPESANTILVEVESPGFEIRITGFDPNRDLVVKGRTLR